LIVYDIVNENCGKLVDLGAKVADSPKAVAAEADVIISMIPDDPALEAVSVGPNGAFQEAKSGGIFIDMSTVSPVISARVGRAAGEKGIMYLRSPVSGSTEFAEAGTLTVLVSGPEKAYEQCQDIFNVLGQKCFYVGKGDEARYLKLLINIMVGITSAMTAEALTFGKRGGLEWDQMIELINSSVVGSPLIGFKVQLLKERKFPPAFTASQMAKDFDLALHTGRSMDIPMPITAFTRELYGAMKATGRGEMDYFGLVALMEEMAGISA
jgi:3-hydroxyisobutyrate dehydrogenase-like beta-hydroxyacid dehydrogenase